MLVKISLSHSTILLIAYLHAVDGCQTFLQLEILTFLCFHFQNCHALLLRDTDLYFKLMFIQYVHNMHVHTFLTNIVPIPNSVNLNINSIINSRGCILDILIP